MMLTIRLANWSVVAVGESLDASSSVDNQSYYVLITAQNRSDGLSYNIKATLLSTALHESIFLHSFV